MAQTFSLANSLGAGRQLKSNLESAEQGRALNALRIDNAEQRGVRDQQTFDTGQRQQGLQKMSRGIDILLERPDLAADVFDEVSRSNVEGFEPQKRGEFIQLAQTDPNGFRQKLLDAKESLRVAINKQPQFGAPIAGQDPEGNALFAQVAPTGEVRPLEGIVPRAAGASGGVTGSLQELNAINTARAGRSETPLDPETFLTGRRENAAALQEFRQFKRDNPGTTTTFAEFKAKLAGSVAGATETGKLKAQIAAIPEKVQVQYKADFKAGAPQRIRAANNAIVEIDSLMEEADLALDDIGITTTGLLGSISRRIAGTSAFALARKIDTLQANLSFKRIREMRANSPTGGALGQVSERELALLGASVVALDQANSEDEVRRAFKKVLFHYNNWKAVVTGERDADEMLLEGDLSGDLERGAQQPQEGGQDNQQLIQKAQQAIQEGADPDAVRQRLNELGVDTTGL